MIPNFISLDDDTHIKLHPVEIALSVIGIVGNVGCCVLMSRNRLMPDRKVNMNAQLGLVQSILDFLSCSFYLISMVRYPRIENVLLGVFVCRIIKSKSLFWLVATLRAGINVVIGILNFVKLLYPFLSTAGNLVGFLSFGIVLLVIVSIIQIVPNVGMVSYNTNDMFPNCNYSAIETFKEATKLVGILRFFALFTFIYLYIFPLTVTLFVYKQILNCLKDSSDVPRQIVYKEIMKSFLLDNVFYCVCFSFHNISLFLSQFTTIFAYDITSKSYRLGMLLVVLYAIFYPYISMTTRRSYKKSMIDISKIMGFTPSFGLKTTKSSSKHRFQSDFTPPKFNRLFSTRPKLFGIKRTSAKHAFSDEDDDSF